MRTVKDILEVKGATVFSVQQKSTVFDALKLMSERQIGAVIVLDETATVRGILSERDYARKVLLQGRQSRETSVAEIMTPRERLHTVAPTNTLENCMVLMTAKHVRHLPVFEGSRFVGLVSIGDVVMAIISEKQDLINQLHDYITRP